MANAFFRAGEIAAWGRGIAGIFNACRQGGEPESELKFDAGGVWMRFGFDETDLRAVASTRTPPVTPEVGRLLSALSGQTSRAELMLR